MGNIATTIAAPANVVLAYAEGMLKEVKPQQFARLASPGGTAVQSNHPAWVFGHLSVYNCRIMDMLGRARGVTENPAGFEDLFKNGTPCKDDASGTIYPTMEKVTSHFFNGFKAAVAAVKEADDAVLMQPNPAEGRMKELFPTKGQMIAFLLAAHPMSHLGQVSGWRRMMGLGSAM